VSARCRRAREDVRLFACQRCGQLLEFERTRCERCRLSLGYLPARGLLSVLEPASPDVWRPLAAPDAPQRYCANRARGACNWMVPADSVERLCVACRLNRTIPNLGEPRNVVLWRRIELAKHRLIDGLLCLGLPLRSWIDSGGGLAFDFLAQQDVAAGGAPVTSGHRGGVITIEVNEADDAWREASRIRLAEPYRTLLGHLRHEVGHYYWDRLIVGTAWHERCRAVFGDETRDYDASLARHYVEGPPHDWNEQFISPYASAHPWEDWAETWAHYLHMLDTLDTAYALGLSLSPRQGRDPGLSVMENLDPYGPIDVETLIGRWLPLILAGNHLNRSMGQPDLYPFVITPVVIEKLRVVHDIVRSSRAGRCSAS
jgi:hypothetical protein